LVPHWRSQTLTLVTEKKLQVEIRTFLFTVTLTVTLNLLINSS